MQFREVFLTRDYLGIAMEYAAGGDMFQHVTRRRGLSEDESRWFFQQLILGLDYCHKMVNSLNINHLALLRKMLPLRCIQSSSRVQSSQHRPLGYFLVVASSTVYLGHSIEYCDTVSNTVVPHLLQNYWRLHSFIAFELDTQGVVNRDIKLENTLLDGSRRPLLKICGSPDCQQHF